MTTQIRLKFISDGFRQILNGSGVQTLVAEKADEMKDRANANNTHGGEGFAAHTWKGGYGGGRWVASVTTTDHNSMVAESEGKALSKAVK